MVRGQVAVGKVSATPDDVDTNQLAKLSERDVDQGKRNRNMNPGAKKCRI